MLVARLQHPHILAVHDSGEAGGNLWFTMPFVEGESLRGRLDRGRLPFPEALRITREIADALDYAHDRGVIHRDVKPENILLSGQHALMADFGIARLVGGDKHLTSTGIAIGTPEYMSPEQATADRAVDARTDVYALGRVVAEMLVGQLPPALHATIARATAPLPADRFSSAGDFVRALEAASAAARTPRRRPLFAMLSIGFLLGAGVLFAWNRSRGGAAREPAKVLAVLPFENMGSADQEYFADGVTDEVRGKLANLQTSGLEVIGRVSSAPFKHSSESPQHIAQALGAQYLLTATVRWERLPGGRNVVHVSPELLQVRGGSAPISKWQQSFDAELTDIFRVQGDIARRVTEALDVALGSGAREQLVAAPTANLAAYQAFLRGEQLSTQIVSGNALGLRQAVRLYEEAVQRDSTFIQAWTQLSRAHSALFAFVGPNAADSAAAARAALRALALAPQRGEAHLAMGDFNRLVTLDARQALAQYRQSESLVPGNIDVIIGMARSTGSMGLAEQALRYAQRAATLDPRSASAAFQLGVQLLDASRLREALQVFDRGLAVQPGDLNLLEGKAMVFLMQADLPGARAVLVAVPQEDQAALVAYFGTYYDLMWVLTDEQQRLLLRLGPSLFAEDRALWSMVQAETYAVRGDMAHARAFADTARRWYQRDVGESSDPAPRLFLGLALAYLGRGADAVRAGEQGLALIPPSRDVIASAYYQHELARIYILAGEEDKAIALLKTLLTEPYHLSPGWLSIDPNFAPLRGNPRFQELLRR